MNNAEVEIGTCKDIIMSSLEDAKDEIIVVSPWISEGYAKMLKQRKDEGLNVEVYTSDQMETGNHRDALKYLTSEKGGNSTSRIGLLSILGILLGLIGGNIGFFLSRPLLVIASLVVGVVSMVSLIVSRKSGVKWSPAVDHLEVYSSRLHSKIYIADEDVIISSANFTYTGLNKNFETAIKFQDKEIREELIEGIGDLDKRSKKKLDKIAEKARRTL